MAACILIFLALSAVSAVGAAFYNKRFETLLPFGFAIPALLLFLFGAAGFLEAGFYLALALCLLAYIACALRIALKKNAADFVRAFFTPAFALFCLSFLLLVYINAGREAYLSDEMSHWAVAVRSMVHFDALTTGSGAGISFSSYPPMMTLMQYFFVKLHLLCGGSGFAQWYMYLAWQLFALSFVFPFLSARGRRGSVKSALMLACAALAPMLIYGTFYYSLYIDAFLGMVCGCGWAALLCGGEDERDRKQDGALVLLCAAVLSLSKDSGVALAAFLLAGLLLEVWRGRLAGGKKLLCSLAVLSALVPRLIWNVHLALAGTEKAFSQKVELPVLFSVLLGRDESWRSEFLARFKSFLVSGRVLFGPLSIPISYAMQMLLLMAGVALIVLLWKKGRGRGGLLILLLVQNLCYVVGLLVLYLFKLSEAEAMELASLPRYLGTMLLADLMLLLILGMRRFMARSALAGLLGLALLLLLSPLGTVASLANRWNIYVSQEAYMFYGPQVEQVREHAGEDERVWFISQEQREYEFNFFRYHLFPRLAEQSEGWSLGPRDAVKDPRAVDLSVEEWEARLMEDFDYVYILRSNELFESRYAPLFEDPAEIADQRLFRVDKDGGELALILVE